MRTFDDIIPPSKRRENEMPIPQQNMPPGSAQGPSQPPMRPIRMPRRSRFPFATLTIVILIVAASVAALYYFSGAEVQVTPNAVSASVQSSFTATQSSGDLPYEIVSTTKVATQSVQGSGTKQVSASASGDIAVYNTRSAAQKLISGTRFATASGLIFKIHKAITVPAGTAAKPGSVTATVYADQAGATYNVGPTSFTLPGLAGSALSSDIYARSVAAMTGGASGTVPVVDAATESSATKSLQGALAPDLAAALVAQVPSGYVLLPGAATTTYTELAPAPSATTGMVDVKEQGTATAVVFPSAALAKAVANTVPGMGYQGEPVTLAGTNGLTLSSPVGLPDPSATSFTFTLSGTANIIYTIDASRIASAVAGKTRSAAEVALTNYPEVKRAILVLRPFWRGSFPQDPTAIRIIVASSTTP